jgi:hypothetical protein
MAVTLTGHMGLTSEDIVTDGIDVRAYEVASAEINPDPNGDGDTWGTANTVTVQWALENDPDMFRAFSTTITMNQGTTGVTNIPVAAVNYIRFKVTAADGTGSPDCTWTVVAA